MLVRWRAKQNGLPPVQASSSTQPDRQTFTAAITSLVGTPTVQRVKIFENVDITRGDDVDLAAFAEVDTMLARYRHLMHRKPKPSEHPAVGIQRADEASQPHALHRFWDLGSSRASDITGIAVRWLGLGCGRHPHQGGDEGPNRLQHTGVVLLCLHVGHDHA